MALVGFQYEPVNLDLNEICFEEVQNILNTREKSRKSQSVNEWCRCGKWGIMHTNVVLKFMLWRYFQLLDMRYDDRNVVTKELLVQQSCNFT